MAEDKCAPWQLPDSEHTIREEVKTSTGWHIGMECVDDTTKEGVTQFLSYYYPDNEATYSCTTGSSFTPEKVISCQGKTFSLSLT